MCKSCSIQFTTQVTNRHDICSQTKVTSGAGQWCQPVQVVLWGAEGEVVAQDRQTGAEVGPLNQLTERSSSLHHGFKPLAAASSQGTRIKQHLEDESWGQ